MNSILSPSRSYKTLAAVLPLLAGLILPERAAADTVVMHVLGTPTGYNMGGVYTSPYSFTVNSVPGFLLACDDFATDINFGDTWLANRLDFSSTPLVVGGPQKFNTVSNGDGTNTVTFPDGTTAHYTIQQQYDAVAWLAAMLMFTPSISSDQAGYYSFAIWQIFDSKAELSLKTSTQLNAVNTDMHNAFAATQLPAPASVFIYTPIPPTAPNSQRYIYPSQEFIGVTHSITTLDFPSVPDRVQTLGLLALGGIVLLGFRQAQRN